MLEFEYVIIQFLTYIIPDFMKDIWCLLVFLSMLRFIWNCVLTQEFYIENVFSQHITYKDEINLWFCNDFNDEINQYFQKKIKQNNLKMLKY